MDLNTPEKHTCKQLMRVKFPPKPFRAQYVKGSCNSPTRPLKVLSMATILPKFVKPNRAPKMAK